MKSIVLARRSVISLIVAAGAAAASFATNAQAAPPRSDKQAPLPRWVHRTQSGRYLEDMCKEPDPRKARCLGKWLLPIDWTPDKALPNREAAIRPLANTCSGSLTGMGPADVTAAYNIPSGTKSNGKIVALIDAEDGTAYGDVAGYRAAASITALPQCATVPSGSGSPCFAQVDSETGTPIASPTSVNTQYDGETGLDMAMVSAACPDCSIVVVALSAAQLNATTWQPFLDAVATAKKLGASAVSISFGAVENTDPNAIAIGASDGGLDPENVYTKAGMPVFVASGDFAFDNGNMALDAGPPAVLGKSPSYPASAPDVISVGGTMLINSSGTYTEAVWDDGSFATGIFGQDVTTSGCSTEFSMPSWQTSALSGSGCGKRATADVAAPAAFATGGASAGIGMCASGGMTTAEGTSAASPFIAGLFTRLGLTDALAANLGWMYEHASAFNDLGSSGYPADTSAQCSSFFGSHPCGSNTDAPSPSSCGKLCTVGTGWDGPSGVGTPNATSLEALAPDGGTGSSSSSSSSGGGSSSSSSSSSSGGSSSGGSSSSSGSSSSGGSSGGVIDSGIPDATVADSGGDDGSASSSGATSSSGGSSGTASSGGSSGTGSSGGASSGGVASSSGGFGSSGGTSSGALGEDGGPVGEDGGAVAGDGGANGDNGGSSSGCSCDVAGHDASGLEPLGVALGFAALGVRRRRKRA